MFVNTVTNDKMLVSFMYRISCFSFKSHIVCYNLVYNKKNKLLTKRQKLSLVQIKSICKRQNKCDYNIENIVGKGENDGYNYVLLFPQFLFKIVFGIAKNQDCVVKG